MAGPIPAEFVETVRNNVDVVEFISEYVVLKRRGQNYVGLCPFHHEKTPSFTVSAAKQVFYCFGCGMGGNVFTFLMKKDHLSFPEAVEALAHRVGLEIPGREQVKGSINLKNRYYELNLCAADFYYKILWEKEAGERAREYLRKRGIEPESWKKFLLGFAPETGTALQEVLQAGGYSRRTLAEVGLIVTRQGRSVDRFRDRIIFPIFDSRGRCLGFGGRALGEEQPKYLNSPESLIFSKSRNLYGLNFAVPSIREKGEALVVEGYLDCITAHQYGFTNTCAALGTAFTRDQARLLVRYTQSFILAFDRDAAGSAASLRGAGYLQELGGRVYVLDFPFGKDPDEFLRTQGKDAFALALENRKMSYIEFKLEQLACQHDPETVYGRAEIINELLEDLAKIDNLVVRDGYFRLIARHLQLPEDVIRSEFFRYLARQQVRKDRNEKIRYTMEQGKRTFVAPAVSAAVAAQRGLFRLMCLDQGVWERVKKELGLDVFQEEKLSYYVELLKEARWVGPASLLDLVEESRQAELASLLLAGDEQVLEPDQQAKLIDDYIRVLKKERLNVQIKRRQEALREREGKRDLEGIKALMAELRGLYAKLKELKSTP